MKPELNTLWQYVGKEIILPGIGVAPHGQIHKVVYSSPLEVVTNGIPFGCGGTWAGPVAQFEAEFNYKGKVLP